MPERSHAVFLRNASGLNASNVALVSQTSVGSFEMIMTLGSGTPLPSVVELRTRISSKNAFFTSDRGC